MATVNSNTSSNSNLLMSYFEKRALATLKDEVRFLTVTDKIPLPKGSGTSITFNAWRVIGAASSTLSEHSASANAVTPLSSRKVTASILSYGRAVKWTDTLELTSVLPVEPGALAALEQSAALTVDNIVQFAAIKNRFVHCGKSTQSLSCLLSAWMSAKASVFCADTGASDNAQSAALFGFPVVFGTSCAKLSAMHKASAATTSISANMGPIAINKAVARLRRLSVKPFANGKYIGITHPNAVASMLRNPDYKTWQQGWEGGVKETLYKHQIADCGGVTFIDSPNMPRWEGSLLDNLGKNLNLTLILGRSENGQSALGMTELDGGVKYILHRPEQTADVFELYSTLSYKVRAAAAVLNPSCGVILITQDIVAPITTVA